MVPGVRTVPHLPLSPLPVRRLSRAVRSLIARHPWVYWFAVGAFATWAYLAAAGHTAAADRAQAAWGSTAPVLVATTDLRPGDPLAGGVAVRDWPAALVPPGVLAAAPDDGVARQHVAGGELLGARDVAAAGPLALVPDGWLAVPVSESPPSGAVTGDRVRVASEGVVIAEQALVVGQVDADVTLVAVPADGAALLPLAADAGALTLLREP